MCLVINKIYVKQYRRYKSLSFKLLQKHSTSSILLRFSLSQWRIPRLTMWLMTYKWRKISHLRKYLCRWMYPRVLWCLHTRRHAWNVGDLSNLESPIPLLTLWNLFPIFISYFWEVHMYAWFLCLQHKTEAIGKGLVYATTTKNCLRTLTND